MNETRWPDITKSQWSFGSSEVLATSYISSEIFNGCLNSGVQELPGRSCGFRQRAISFTNISGVKLTGFGSVSFFWWACLFQRRAHSSLGRVEATGRPRWKLSLAPSRYPHSTTVIYVVVGTLFLFEFSLPKLGKDDFHF